MARKTQKPAFDPSDYDYLDNAILPQWVWEFLKRNKEFQNDYVLLNKLAMRTDHSGLTEFVSLADQMLEKYGVHAVPDKIARFSNVHFPKNEPRVALPLHPASLHEDVSENLWRLLRPDSTKDPGRVMVTINLLYTNEEILQTLDDILTRKRKFLDKTRKHRAKWKPYLMVYDIKTQYPELTYDSIGDMLPEVYDARTIENYYKKAERLIESDYKKYLPEYPHFTVK